MSEEENSAAGWSWVIALAAALGAVFMFGGTRSAPTTVSVPPPPVSSTGPGVVSTPSMAAEGAPPAVPEYQAAIHQPLEKATNGYTGSAACRDCHEHNHETWFASYHRTMTQKPDTNSVMGNFDHARFQDHATGYSFRMSSESNQFFITVEPPLQVDHSRHPFPIQTYYLKWPVSLLTGSHHMQGYWVALGKARTMSLAPVMYLKEEQRWISRSSAFLEPPGRRHVFEDGSWNQVCIRCHATDGHTSPAPEGGLESRVTEFGISCEACHGPGESHVKLRRQAAATGAEVPEDPIVNPRSLGHERSSQVCGACHGRTWITEIAPTPYRPGGDLFADRHLIEHAPEVKTVIDRHLAKHPLPDGVTNSAALLDSYFWSDGMARVSSAEYNGMVTSPCYQRGEMSCFSCHQLHQSKSDERPAKEWANDQLRHDRLGDRSCTQCHKEGKYPTSQHTRHQIGSAGSSCLNCHQPHTSYGLLKAIRSHTVSSPSVAKTVETGRPNACNLCHLDKSLGWTSQYLADWYGQPKPSLDADQREISAAVLDALKGDASLRALTAWSMGWEPARQVSGTDWLAPYLALLMEDPYDAVRFIASRSLRKQKAYQSLPYDFLGEPSQRKQMAVKLTENWMMQRRFNYHGDAIPSILVGTNGLLDGATFLRLRQARDNRRIGLNE